MKLSKKKEKELMQVYEAYWVAYLKGNVDAMQSLLDDSYTQVGSAASEVFSSKKEAVQFLVDTIDQVAGKLEMRNRSTKLEQQGHLILIHELCDLYALADKKWIFYSKFRASTLLQEKKEGWKITHQHSSFPDTKTEEGQNVAIEKIAEENLQLRGAVKRRTVELEHKNRELQIEAALERVRARTMAMHHTSELQEVINTVHSEFLKLNIAITGGAFISINDEIKKEINCWGAGGTSNYIQRVHVPFLDRPIYTGLITGIKKGPALFSETFSNKEKVEFFEHLFKHPPYSESTGKKKKEVISRAGGYSRSCIVSKYTSIFIINHHGENFSDAENEILKRFGTVFEQAYTRFLDLKKAEAQVRESQIELGLQRVRARAMGMQKSDELSDLVDTVFKELTKLDFALSWCIINIIDESTMSNMVWGANPEIGKPPESYHMKFEDFRFHHEMFKAWKERNTKWVITLKGDEKEIYDDYLFSETEFRRVPKPVQEQMRSTKQYVSNFTFSNFGGLQTIAEIPLTEENVEILSRFGKVFDLTYTRFNDLLKAEAQAREAQIEAALEKVRSRTMAMQHSNELQEAALLMFGQIETLGVPVFGCGFNIWDDDRKAATSWMAGKDRLQPSFKTSSSEDIFLRIHAAAQKGESLFVEEQAGEELKTHYKYMVSIPVFKGIVDKMGETGLSLPNFQIMHCAFFSQGYLMFISFEPYPEAHGIFKRFAKVFEQTYTRFLDLKKAEAQAREGQIELAIERVRNRAMTMMKSDELADLIITVFKELQNLDLALTRCLLWIFNSENQSATTWMTNAEDPDLADSYDVPKHGHPAYKSFLKGWKTQKLDWEYHLKGKIKERWDDILVEGYFKSLPRTVKNAMKAPERVILSGSFNKYGVIQTASLEPISNENKGILKRFSQVFEQTYTRFLDLKKAEAQAKEAQIEAALERIRSRSLAMHNSNEIGDVAFVLFQQLKSLGGELWGTGFGFCENNSDVDEYWFANENGVMPQLKIPNTIDPSHKQMYQGWKKNLESLSIVKDGKELKDHYKYMLTVPDVQPIFQGLLDNGIAFPKWQKWHAAYFKYGYLLVITTEVYKNEVVFKRFAKVFEQAYTRFLDLQKAEAQAREAQIEASLERVRAKALAMHGTEGLTETVGQLFQELDSLDISLLRCGVGRFHKHTRVIDLYTFSADGKGVPVIGNIELAGHPVLNKAYRSWIKQEEYHAVLKGASLKKYYQTIKPNFKLPGKQDNQVEYGYFLFFPAGVLYTFTEIPLSEEELSIFRKFSSVVGLTYRRYLDLEEAEEQAREAQIEAALERVRSRSMAMHNSNELKDVVKVIFDQMAHLKIIAEHAGIVVDYEPKKDFHFWVADNQDIPAKITVPYLDLPWDKQFTEAKKKGKNFFKTQLDFKEKNNFYKKLLPHIEGLTKEAWDFYLNCPGLAASTAIQKDIGLYIENFSGIPFSDEENSILIRFGKVFQQTYTRFLDLQKAEAQAKEAQIEIGLERVRAEMMAMHKSEELRQVVGSVFTQLQNLGFEAPACGMIIYNEDNSAEHWFAGMGHDTYPKSYKIPYVDNPYFTDLLDAWKNGTSFQEFSMEGKLKIDYAKWLLKHSEFKYLPKEFQKEMLSPDFMILSDAFNKYGMLEIIGPKTLSEDKIVILKRFTKVFEQTYTRFLDLQKAEAQAREAQIEMALEKVRSRTMAMQNSSELPEAANNLFLQVQELGIPAWSAGYCIWEDNKKSASCNMSSEGEIQKGFSLPTIGEGYNFQDPYKKGEHFYVAELGGKKLVKHYDFMKTLPIVGEVLEGFDKKGISLPTFQIFHIVYFTHGYLMFITYEAVLNDWDIFKRFGKVFQQTYTRFQDLQKAEAQTREAQIEAALERTRTQSMLMQHSDELNTTAQVFHEQLQFLGIDSEFSYLWLPDEDEKNHMFWATWSEINKRKTIYRNKAVTFPLDKSEPSIEACYIAWESGETVHVNTVEPNKVEEYFNTWPELLNGVDKFKPELFPDGLYYIDAYMEYGCFGIMIKRQLDEDEKNILSRFSKEFQRTYTRFLDLQKAEAQTRQAQINLAVERVRAKALAMHKSEEIIEVVAKLKDEVMNLDIPDVVAATIFLNEGDDKVRMWDLSSLEFDDNHLEVPFDLTFKIKKTDPHLYVKRVWENQEDYFVEIQDEKDFKRLMQWLRELHKNEVADEVEDFIEKTQLKRLYHSAKKLNNGKLVIDQLNPPSDEMETILTKMGAAFDLAYRRFEDLQKAEAQTREAQIEAALEKVRSRSLAMHKPDELQEVVAVVAEKLKELGVIFDAGGVILCTYFPDNKDVVHWITVDDFSTSGRYFVPYFDNPIFSEAWDSKNRGDAFFSKEFPVEAKNDFFKQAFEHSDYKQMPDDYKQFVLQADSHTLSAAWSKNSAIIIPSLTGAVPSESDAEIMKRFAKVFEQAYIRFMDLQKAEAQTRESQIEAALERVRSRSMAMHNSEELLDVITVVSEQLQKLDIKFHNVSFGINDENKDYKFWLSSPQQLYPFKLEIPYLDNDMPNRVFEAQKNKVSFFTDILTKEESDAWHNHLLEHSGNVNFHENTKNFISSTPGYARSTALMTSIFLTVGNYALIPYSKEENDIFKRFANVFEQSYTRFLDLQKAEAQAREAQIETALEKVRSRSLAMHKSDEVGEVASILLNKLQELKATIDDESVIVIHPLESAPRRQSIMWLAAPEMYASAIPFTVPYSGYKLDKTLWDAIESGVDYITKRFTHKVKNKWFEWAFEHSDFKDLPEDRKKYVIDSKDYRYSVAIQKHTSILIPCHTGKLLEASQIEILKRFSKVFEQAYIRFMDLQKAEAQARESQIEAALERVRSRSMAMHKSEELLDVISVVSEQLQELNFKFVHVSFANNDNSQDYRFWTASKGMSKPMRFNTPYLDIAMFNNMREAQEKSVPFYTDILTKEEHNQWHTHLLKHGGSKVFSKEENEFIMSRGMARSIAINPNIILILANYASIPYTEDDNKIIERFGQVFEQCYTRFLDLQKAEAQAREAQIEASLERVRSKAMAMHSTDDLSDAIKTFYNEFVSLSAVPVIRLGVAILSKDSQIADITSISKTDNMDLQEVRGTLDFSKNPSINQAYKNWRSQSDYLLTLRGTKLKAYYQNLNTDLSVPEFTNKDVQYIYFQMFTEGTFYVVTENKLEESELHVYRKFTSVLSLTYKRYKDLIDAEAREKEAIKQSSLDRVRAEIASMRNTKDLERITPLIWKELKALGVPFFRCGVFIIREEEQMVHAYLSKPSGDSLAALHISFDNTEIGIIQSTITNWRLQKDFYEIWDQDQFINNMETFMKHGQIESIQKYQAGETPPEKLVLQLVPFKQGMLYAGNSEPLIQEHIDLMKNLAQAFSVAYSRYEDFIQLELAKASAEGALSELQLTQTQLIQSEKMASLGELTAGIAHEIQNPLNFVNNFSEVSNELIDEMNEEIEKGDLEEAKAIADDIKQNLEKINHHGKRADGIVKGMLQHSRSSSGQKEPTDINALADEYLRLAYHGLRAKDKSFNVSLNTDFDDTIGKIAVNPQEIGRVILNLITNAFYAVNEKKQQSQNGFEPRVSVRTKKKVDTFEISVSDNGGGIPQKVLDKVFQPFFTTKPTGQGTGLGLSLSYDIVKAHGGELEVATSLNEGTTFSIQLPIENL